MSQHDINNVIFTVKPTTHFPDMAVYVDSKRFVISLTYNNIARVRHTQQYEVRHLDKLVAMVYLNLDDTYPYRAESSDGYFANGATLLDAFAELYTMPGTKL